MARGPGETAWTTRSTSHGLATEPDQSPSPRVVLSSHAEVVRRRGLHPGDPQHEAE